jgi:hypothetical protein
MTYLNRISRIALIASALATPAVLQAQTPEDQTLPPPDVAAPSSEAAPATEIADAKVDQFAAAFVAVQQIQTEAAQQLNSTEDEQKATEVKNKAEKQMIEAVQREGLQVEEFNQIADLMATDMTLRSRVLDKVQKRTQGTGERG